MGRQSRAKTQFRAEVHAELSRRPTRWESVRWGLEWGIGMAVVFSLFVIVQSLLRGSFYYERYSISTWTIVGAYAVAGITAGIVAGVLRPMTARRAGAILLGMLVGVVVYGIVGIAMFGLHWAAAVSALVAGSLVGGMLGWRWSDPSNPLRQREHDARIINAILRVNERRQAARNRR